MGAEQWLAIIWVKGEWVHFESQNWISTIKFVIKVIWLFLDNTIGPTQINIILLQIDRTSKKYSAQP